MVGPSHGLFHRSWDNQRSVGMDAYAYAYPLMFKRKAQSRVTFRHCTSRGSQELLLEVIRIHHRTVNYDNKIIK